MCDYSLQDVKSRAAQVGDKLITHNFGKGTRGFADAKGEGDVAVCVLPGTELAFETEPEIYNPARWFDQTEPAQRVKSKTARFRQIDTETKLTHHDALEFADGETIKLHYLAEGQWATVLQLPAAPKTEEEAKAQQRLEVVG